VCAACPPGTFGDDVDAPACAPWSICPGGGWAAEGTSTADRSCECLAGDAGVVDGDVLAQSQAEVDALAGVREIVGSLRILGLAQTPRGRVITDTSSIAALACLEVVTGALMITDHRHLRELTGLTRLTRVDTLSIRDNQVLSSLDGLDALTFTHSVDVTDNDHLVSMAALAGLTVVRDSVTVASNNLLTDLAGLHNLESVGRLVIRGNGLVVSLSPLSALRTVRGSLEIDSTQLTSLTGLEGLDAVGASLIVFSNSSLTSLAGLENVTRAGQSVRIGYNPSLPSLHGLERLASIGEGFTSSENGLRIYVNSALNSLAGLDGLQTLVGPLLIYGNEQLSRCQAEALATRLDTTCTSSIDPWTCSEVCTCGGNLNDVDCAD
jgi:hypothetical protein